MKLVNYTAYLILGYYIAATLDSASSLMAEPEYKSGTQHHQVKVSLKRKLDTQYNCQGIKCLRQPTEVISFEQLEQAVNGLE